MYHKMIHSVDEVSQLSDGIPEAVTVPTLKQHAVTSTAHELESDGASFISALSEHSEDESVGGSSDDDSLADFIVNDSADEAELRRGSPRKPTVASPPRRRIRRMVIESDSSDDDDDDDDCTNYSPLSGGQKPREADFDVRDETADDLIPQVDALRLSPPSSYEALRELANAPVAVSRPDQIGDTKTSTMKKPTLHEDENTENSTGATEENSDEPVSHSSPPPAPSRKPLPTRTQSTTATQEKQRQRAFASHRDAMARHWLAELDATITDGQLAQKTASSGGVAIVWSPRMRKTAGQALSRRDKTGSWSCTITLSSSLLTDEDRLYNTLAHEFAHLAVTLMHMGTCKPHGAEFFAYGAAIARAFPQRGIVFGRCHRYDVQFKYAWQCGGCAAIFQRHSKSLDPEKVRCGRCRGRIALIRPLGGEKKGLSTYQAFVKERFADTKDSLKANGAGTSAKEVMRELSRLWKVAKEAKKAGDGEGGQVEGEKVVGEEDEPWAGANQLEEDEDAVEILDDEELFTV